jgi:glycerol 3-phosphatase-2
MSLRGCAGVLAEHYDVALLDLDGVVYVGEAAVPGAVAALGAARKRGMRLAFVTNNAARSPQRVAAHLRELGIAAEADEVITSAQAAAHYLADRLPAAAAVLILGAEGLVDAVAERGLTPVHSADDDPVAVVQGYSPDMNWRLLAEGAVAIQRGALWVATNLDPTLPSPRGPLPGNGSLVAALRLATGASAVSTGKPDPTMHRETVERSGARFPLVVGDRLDTDVQGATAVGCDSLLVLSGVTTPPMLLRAAAEQRPDYIAADVAGLLVPHPHVELRDGQARCGGWLAAIDDGRIRLVRPVATSSADDLDALRALCVCSWAMSDPAVTMAAADDDARAVLTRLGL